MKEINIAYGEYLIFNLNNEYWDSAIMCIKTNNGDIVGYTPGEDIEELFKHIRGSEDFREVTEKELNEINQRL
jgi:hypothetical protein